MMKTLEEKILSLADDLNRQEGATPLYTQLADLIKLVIKTGGHKSGEKFPTERVMSEAFGLSRGTVRKTLDELISDNIVEKVQGKGIYLCDKYVPKLPKLNVGLVFINDKFDISHPLNSGHIKGICSVLDNYEYTLNYIGVDSKIDKVKLRRDFEKNNINGIISFMQEDYMNNEIKKVIKNNVFVTKLEANKSAYIDFGKVIEIQMNYLYKQGHRNIMFTYCNLESEHSYIMYKGYSDFCDEKGLEKYFYEFETYSAKCGKASIKEITKNKDITAVIAADDYIAMGMIAGLSEINLKCPDDISIIGMGDFDFAPYLVPGLTTLYMPYFDVGVNLANALINKKNNENLQPVFVERKSVKKLN